MTKKRLLSCEYRKKLREILSCDPFFKEMDKHLHKSGFCSHGYDERHLSIEEIWYFAIDFIQKSDIVYHDAHVLTNLMKDDDCYDAETCHWIAVVKCHLMMMRYYEKRDLFYML